MKLLNYLQIILNQLHPKSVKVEVRPHHGGEPYVSTTDIIAYKAASQAMKTTYGRSQYL